MSALALASAAPSAPAHATTSDPEEAIDDDPVDTEAADTDTDGDGVSDLRDVCLDPFGGPVSPTRVDRFGCERADGAGTRDGREVLVIDTLVFPAGESDLDGDARAVLDRLARALLASGDDALHEIGVHTDGAGPRARNLRLSARRAEAVRRYLMLRGVGPNRLRARGHGESRPLADDATPSGRRTNRRIELVRVGER